MAKPIGTLGNVDTLTVGGVTFTDLDNLIVLCATTAGTGTNNSTFRKPSGASGYQVTAGLTYTIRAVRMYVGTAGVVSNLCYSDNDVGNSSNTSYTNKVYMCGAAVINYVFSPATGGSTHKEYAPFFKIPALKYPGLEGQSASADTAHIIYGYEA